MNEPDDAASTHAPPCFEVQRLHVRARLRQQEGHLGVRRSRRGRGGGSERHGGGGIQGELRAVDGEGFQQQKATGHGVQRPLVRLIVYAVCFCRIFFELIMF